MQLEPAYVLHSLPYKETSLVLELWTAWHGRLPVVAKGAKRPHSALRPVIMQFQPLWVRYTGRGEVKTLTHAEWAGAQLPPRGQALFAAYYLNELVMRSTLRDEPLPDLFVAYQAAITALAQPVDSYSLAVVVRRFELALLSAMGMAVSFQQDLGGQSLDREAHYGWSLHQGWQRLQDDLPLAGWLATPPIAGCLLLQIHQAGVNTDAEAQTLRALTRHLIGDMLGQASGPAGLVSRLWMNSLHE